MLRATLILCCLGSSLPALGQDAAPPAPPETKTPCDVKTDVLCVDDVTPGPFSVNPAGPGLWGNSRERPGIQMYRRPHDFERGEYKASIDRQ